MNLGLQTHLLKGGFAKKKVKQKLNVPYVIKL